MRPNVCTKLTTYELLQMSRNRAKCLKTPAQARQELDRRGQSIAEFARNHALDTNIVYQVLAGTKKGRRGDLLARRYCWRLATDPRAAVGQDCPTCAWPDAQPCRVARPVSAT